MQQQTETKSSRTR